MLKKIGIFLLSLLLAIIILMAAVLLYVNTPVGKDSLSRWATQQFGRDVRLEGSIKIVPAWPLTLRISQMRIANMENGRAENMADIGELEVGISLLPLFIGKLHLPHLAIADTSLNLERDANGNANWRSDQDEEADEAPALPIIGELHIENSHLSYWDAPRKIDIRLDAHTQEQEVIIKGEGTYQGKAFSMNGRAGSLLEARSTDPYPVDMALKVGLTTLHAKGTVSDPTHRGGMNITLRIKGADAGELFPLLGIALPPTGPYDLHGELSYENAIWKFTDFSGRMGDSDLNGDLTWNKALSRPKFTANFISKNLDFKDLGPLIGLAPEVPLTAEQKKKAVQQEVSPHVIPDVPLDITRISAMDADVTFTGKRVISRSLPLDDFYVKISLDNRILKMTPLKFGTANGDIAANLVVNSRAEPVTVDGDFDFRRLSLARLMEGLGKKLPNLEKAEGFIGGTAELKGHGKSLHDMLSTSNGNVGIGMEGGTLSNLLIELIGLDVAQSLGFLLTGDQPVAIRCVVASFDVKNGLMHSRSFVIDTSDTNVQGEGTINLKDEALKLRFEAKPKDATMLSLRAPIRVEGTLKHPNVNIEKEGLAARSGVAAALSVLTPLAAMFAFIEPSLGEDSNCAQLIRDMDAHTGKGPKEDQIPKN